MSYAIGLYFDKDTEKNIRSLWRAMAENGVSDYLHLSENRPHFTLAIFTDLDISLAEKRLAVIAAETRAIPVLFSYIGCFPSEKPDLFIGPAGSPQLLDLHMLVNQCFIGLGTYPDFDYYLPGFWVPHCAIAMGIDYQSIQNAMDVARNLLKIPFEARIEEIGLIEFRPVKHLFHYRIGGEPGSPHLESPL